MRVFATVFLLPILCAAGCGPAASPPDAAKSITPEDMTPRQQGQRELALKARDALFQQLSGRLMDVMGSSGPVAAIAVCKEEAPRLAQEVGREYGVGIGRTSHRLRNSQNAPPDWAQPFVQQRTGQPRFRQLENGELAALLPIRLQAKCLMCHGKPENMLADVKQALQEHYPDDQATGFEEDDLRGWFWVTVPAAAPPTAGSTAEDSTG
jgi:hypothetical protein